MCNLHKPSTEKQSTSFLWPFLSLGLPLAAMQYALLASWFIALHCRWRSIVDEVGVNVMHLALVVILSTFGFASGADDKAPSADEIMQRVRQAMNFSRDKIPETGLILEGKYITNGSVAVYRMQFNRQGHFLQQYSVTGTRVTASGYDGNDVWSKNAEGETELLELSERRASLLWAAFLSGIWIDKTSGMTYTLARDLPLPDEYLLQFTHEPSQFVGTISINKKSLLPHKCKFALGSDAFVIMTWRETISCVGMTWPRIIETSVNDAKRNYQWDSATPADKTVINPFRPRLTPPAHVTFDASKAALLEVKDSKTSGLLVRPLVNGQDVGWFLLNGGFGGNILYEQTARKLKLETFGDGEARVLDRSVKANWCRPKSLLLGRMTLQEPLVHSLDLPAFPDDPIAGIIGDGIFRSAVIELDPVTAQIALFDPKTYEQERGTKQWQRLYISKGLGADAEVEGHKGVVRIDLGSTKKAVDIHTPAVKKLNLLEGREVKTTISPGKEIVKKGKLKYFEIGGHRHEEVESEFATSETGLYSDPDYLGTIGLELLKPFQLVVDCQNRRIAFIKRDVK
jgi:hypothetical protein